MGARKQKSKKRSDTNGGKLLEQTTFFVDYCLGKHVGEVLRKAGLKVELHLSHFAQDAQDTVWLAAIGARGWVVLTKDKGIRRKKWELEKVVLAKVRLFTLSSGNMTGEEMAQAFLNNLKKIGRHLFKTPAPFAAVVLKHDILPVKLPELTEDSDPQ